MFESSQFKPFPLKKSHYWSLGAFLFVLMSGVAASMLVTDAPPEEPDVAAVSAIEIPAPEPESVDIPIPPIRPERTAASSVEKLGVRPPPAPLITGSIQSAANPTAPKFVLYENRDMFGGDYDSIRNVSRPACEQRCRSDRRCRAYTFNKWQGICFLKSSIGAIRIEPQGTTGIAAPVDVSQDQRPPSIQKTSGRRLPGAPYRTLTAHPYQGCASVCLADPQCLGFNYSRIERTCALMSSVDKPTRAKTTDIGIKLQRPPRRTRTQRSRPFPHGDIPPHFAPAFDVIFGGIVRL